MAETVRTVPSMATGVHDFQNCFRADLSGFEDLRMRCALPAEHREESKTTALAREGMVFVRE